MSIDTLYMQILNFITKLARVILAIFPKSPFRQYIDAMETSYIRASWLAWYFPIREAITITSLWLTAIALFYLVSTIARWVKIIGD